MKLLKFAEMTNALKDLSTCKRLQVSAIIIPYDYTQVYSIGYNGPPKLKANDSCRAEEGACGCVHAEINAMIKLNPIGIKPSILIASTAPCEACAGAILNCDPIIGIVYLNAYRNTAGIDLIDEWLPTIQLDSFTKPEAIEKFANRMKLQGDVRCSH
jgi:deoxycytidylate deaminase